MRIELGPVEQNDSGRWTASFNIWNGRVGYEYLVGTLTGGYAFATEDEAYAAGHRAMTVLDATGRFPNMHEAY